MNDPQETKKNKESYYKKQLDVANSASKQLKLLVEQLTRENQSLKRSVFDLLYQVRLSSFFFLQPALTGEEESGKQFTLCREEGRQEKRMKPQAAVAQAAMS